MNNEDNAIQKNEAKAKLTGFFKFVIISIVLIIAIISGLIGFAVNKFSGVANNFIEQSENSYSYSNKGNKQKDYISNLNYQNYDVYGDSYFDNVSILEKFNVYGKLTAANMQINDFHIYGSANLRKSEINGNLKSYGSLRLLDSLVKNKSYIFGSLYAKNSNFDSIVVEGKLSLKNCVTKDIIIKKDSMLDKVQIIKISGSSNINGDIIFESEHGLVEFSNDSIITGKIIGGKLK